MSRPELSNRFVFDDPRYEQLAIEGEAQYKLGTPFNHMAFDNFLPEPRGASCWPGRTWPGCRPISGR